MRTSSLMSHPSLIIDLIVGPLLLYLPTQIPPHRSLALPRNLHTHDLIAYS